MWRISARNVTRNAGHHAKAQIDAAFKGKKGWWSTGKKPDVVALIVNSGGGSPVQSNLLYKHIRGKSKSTGVPVVAFIE